MDFEGHCRVLKELEARREETLYSLALLMGVKHRPRHKAYRIPRFARVLLALAAVLVPLSTPRFA